jgi:phospholipid/cholesterol/gamma-HCH transport system ATP-binding protein
MALIQMRGITKRFGSKQVLGGVDLAIAQGETHVVLGPSGTGKSVLLKIICGLMEPDDGVVEIGGERAWPAEREARLRLLEPIQMLFQGAALFDSMSVAENVAFHAVEHGLIELEESDEFAREYLDLVELEEAGTLMPAELSGGMKKRVALARALAAKPQIMLYDEPTTGLDPLTAQTINELIRRTQQKKGVTSIVVTHDLKSALVVGDRCSFLHDGHVVTTTTPGHLVESDVEIVRQFAEEAEVRLGELKGTR